MSAVDVIDAAINKVRQHAWPQTMDLEEARAAVAELIESDKEYDEARDACDGTRNTSAFTECWNRLVRAMDRRATALANIGAAP